MPGKLTSAASTERPSLYNSSLARGLLVLKAFEHEVDLGLSQIAEKTGIEKSAVQRFVATLVQMGYLRRDPATRRYRLAARILQFGAYYLSVDPLVERARPYLLDCSKRTGETVNLAVREGDEIILVTRYPGIQMARPDVVIGSVFPWSASSLGQAMVAHLSPDEIEAAIGQAQFTRYARQTILTVADLRKRLLEVREQGYSLAVDEAYDGDISIGAPVFDQAGRPQSAVSIAVLGSSWTPAQARKKLAPILLELAKAISHSSSFIRKS